MHSSGWALSPCTYTEEIDGQAITMLGYRLWETEDDGKTLLRIRKIPYKNKRFLEEALLHFFYPENPLFGELIEDNSRFAVYSGSEMKVPCEQPLGIKGIIYSHGLARGRLPFPLFIMLKEGFTEPRDNRRRELYGWYDSWEMMYQIARAADPECSFKMLYILKPYWNDIPCPGTREMRTWFYVVAQLVRNVCKSEELTMKFRDENPDLWYLEREGSDRKRNAQIRQAKRRIQNHKGIVSPAFRLLGAQALLEKIIEQDIQARPLTDKENAMAEFLYVVSSLLLPGDIIPEPLPQILIGDRKQASADPLSYAVREHRGKNRKAGSKKYRLEKIILSEEDFTGEAFEHTLVVFCEKLLHGAGSKRSNRGNIFFTHLGAELASHADCIPAWKAQWKKLAAGTNESVATGGEKSA